LGIRRTSLSWGVPIQPFNSAKVEVAEATVVLLLRSCAIVDRLCSVMAPPPAASVKSAMPDSCALREEANALAAVQPLLATRQALLRSHRKATCWLFFREVAVRSVANNSETLLSCRICRPDVVSSTGWEEVKGSRGGLVRYSSTSGTSAMRTHVKNVHPKEGMALDRALAMAAAAMTGIGTDESLLKASRSNVANSDAVGSISLGKRDSPGDEVTAPEQTFVKKRREESKAEILRSIHRIQATIDGLHSALEVVKRQMQSL
jgi:hypothetical protein